VGGGIRDRHSPLSSLLSSPHHARWEAKAAVRRTEVEEALRRTEGAERGRSEEFHQERETTLGKGLLRLRSRERSEERNEESRVSIG
jgi:hypothetical protein